MKAIYMKAIYLMTGLMLLNFNVQAQTIINTEKFKEKAQRLLSLLTLEEKVSLTSGRDAWSTQPPLPFRLPGMWIYCTKPARPWPKKPRPWV